MLKVYKWNGSTWQFEEGTQPADAVEVVPDIVKKAAIPQTKVAKGKTK